MTHKQSIGNRITSVILTIAILFTMIPLTARNVSAASVNSNRIADPSTMDDWKELFPLDELSTENAGGVWMDKSVFTDASAFAGLGITQNETDSFLVALSAIAANMSVTGMSNVPTDSILVLDVSGSMNDDSGNNDVAEELVEAANESIKALLEINKYNRVGVVLYSGTSASDTNDDAAIVLLPLGRYTTQDGQYLTYIVTSSGGRNPTTTETVGLDPDVVYEGTEDKPTAQRKEVVGATYIQKGIIAAMDQFIAEGNSVTAEDPVAGSMQRKPVLILMSDGAPTLGSTSFTDPGQYDLGDGRETSAALGFVSQLSAAYAKAKIEEKYGTDALFYTLGLGVSNDSVAIGVLDPDNTNAATALGDFWDEYTAEGATSVTVQSGGRGRPARTVSVIETALEQSYVDQYFSAESETLPDGTVITMADKLKAAFQEIVSAIQLQSSYFPTLISENEDLSGYVSFVDRIGQYMEVTDIKGILIDDQLFSGAELASNFVSGGGKLGTYDNPTALGIEMVAAVRARLGLDSDDTARTLIGLAFENGQLSYTDANNYSNYIGWYANAAGQFLGFYHEGVTVLPEATDNAATDPAFVIKSYGYLGAVDESQGVSESDMMYATVQVRENISTGEQLVTFAVPAALIPVVTYNVTLDENGELSDLTVSGADNPIRLVYEAALQNGINSFNLKEAVSAEYLANEHNINTDGSVNFYTNQWDYQNTTGYGTVNTYSYFNPSRQNDRYYYLEDTPVYADTNGTLYTGEAQPSGTVYRSYQVYKNNGTLRTETVYRELSDAAKATAVRRADGSWYIPKGNVRVNLDGYTIDKTENLTATLGQANIPFVDTHNHSVDEEGYDFYVGATLGNNGKLTVTPETGIKLTKTMAAGAATPTEAFTFTLTNTTNAADDTEYPAWRIQADGTEVDTTVKFENGVATVQLDPGDVLYIGGMTANDTFRIVENETAAYIAEATGLSSAGTVTINSNVIAPVSFVNSDRGTGNLTVAKQVEHDFGVDYQIPADKTFTMTVTLSGIGTANATFTAEHTNGQYTEITTDANGQFTVTLKHGEQFEVFGLPTGTTATVVETVHGTGFTPAYWDNGVQGDGMVTVVKDSTVSVIVVNDYVAEEVYPVNIDLGGTKYVKDADGNIVEWDDQYQFTIVLERYGEDGWEQVDTKVLSKDQQTFSFDMSKEVYDAPGVYSYQVYEIDPEIGDESRADGMIYDSVWHTFSVYVSDADMDGQLEIVRVYLDSADRNIELVNGVYTITADFVNTQTVTVPALATVEIQKVLQNASGSPLVSLAGYNFGLYTDADCTIPATAENIDGVLTIGLNPTDSVGEGWIDIQFDQPETYTFYVKEIAGGINKMSYSENVIKIVVAVAVHSENANALVADVSYFNADDTAYDLGDDGEVEFINIYDPTDTELAINFVSKELTGRDMVPGEFSFEVQTIDTPATTLLEGTNGEQDDVTFNGTLKFDKVGTFFYNIVETSVDGKGVTTDKTTYRIAVTVTDIGGELKASYVLVNATGDDIIFKNTYTATPAEYAIVGTKDLRGRTLLNDEFTFVLTELTVDGAAIQDPRTWTVKNLASDKDNIVFPTITYDKAGTYTYSVEEVTPEDSTAYGISYDTAKFKVTVVVRDNGEGRLYVDEAAGSVTMLNNTPASSLTFVNNYVAKETSAQFSGEKQLTGKVNNALYGGEFAFALYNSNASWERLELRETVENGAGGSFTFTKIDFTTDEDQYFIVVEENGGQTIDGTTYDDTVYRVWVELTDDLKGQLHTIVHIYDGEGVPQDKILFVNVYEITGSDTVTLSGEKTIDGRDFKNGDAFSFELYEADENFNAGETPKITVDMDPDTHKYQITLDYTAADAGKTFYYVLKEKNAGQTIDGIVYSEAEYQIKVVVEDDDKGGIKTTVTVENATTSTLNFVNEYKITTGTSAQFEGTKELKEKDLEDNTFTFDLIASDANWAVGNVLQSKKNVGGKVTFDTVTYMQADDYYYLVVEADGGKTVNGITYDDTVYRIHVKVTDNLDGTLSKTVTMLKVKGETIESTTAIAFVNEYSVTGTDSIELSGEKTFTGREWTEEDIFTFEIYEADDNFENLSVDPVTTATADKASSKFTLGITYGTDDLGKTFHYVVKEKNAGQTIDGITYSNTEYRVTVTVSDNGDGTIDAVATVAGVANDALNFTNAYKSDKTSIAFEGTKTLDGIRELKENDFTFDLYKATESFEIDGAAIQSVKNNDDGGFAFAEVEFTKADTYRFIIKENSQDPIGGVIYDKTQYHITVTVADNGKGMLEVTETTMLKVKDETSEAVEVIAFVNDYSAESANVTVSGNKELSGRDLAEGEFKFLMYAANSEFVIPEGATAMVALNKEGGTFSFDALSFTAVGTYYFVISEDSTVEADRVSFDSSVYYVTIEVTDDENGNLVASDPVIVKKGSTDAVKAIEFTNVYVPKPADITVDINIHKTVVNKGTDSITPEGFEFLLEVQADGVEGITVKSDANGKAKFTLTFTEDDIGKTYNYKLTEVNSGRANVTYSTAEYAICITVTLDEESNTLVATLTVNEAAAAEVVAEFENVYDYTPNPDIPDNPKTGDNVNMALRFALLFISGGAVITLAVDDRKRRKAKF